MRQKQVSAEIAAIVRRIQDRSKDKKLGPVVIVVAGREPEPLPPKKERLPSEVEALRSSVQEGRDRLAMRGYCRHKTPRFRTSVLS